MTLHELDLRPGPSAARRVGSAGAPALLLLLAALACNLPGSAPPSPTAPPTAPAAAATAEIAAALATATFTPVPPTPTPTSTPEPTAVPLFHLVFADGGDAWYSDGLAPARRLTGGGGISEVFLSDDGQLAALLLRDPVNDTAELQVIQTDGSDRRTLLRAEEFDRLHPLEGFLHITPSRLAFVPGTHSLLFNTRAVFEGPGLAKFDDLFALDGDSGVLTPLLPPGSGGDFWFSPDGGRLALVRPDSIGVVGADGGDPHLRSLTFLPVITYSEYSYYPLPVWSPDSSLLRVVIPSPDPFASRTGGDVWNIPADGSPPMHVRELSGDLFRPQAAAALISPDLAWLAFTRNSSTPGGSQLILTLLVDGAETVYDRGTIQWTGWAPDSRHFVYSREGGAALQLGQLGSPPSPLAAGIGLRWLDGDTFLYLSGSPGSWSIMLGGLGEAARPLAAPAGDFVSFDVAASSP